MAVLAEHSGVRPCEIWFNETYACLLCNQLLLFFSDSQVQLRELAGVRWTSHGLAGWCERKADHVVYERQGLPLFTRNV